MSTMIRCEQSPCAPPIIVHLVIIPIIVQTSSYCLELWFIWLNEHYDQARPKSLRASNHSPSRNHSNHSSDILNFGVEGVFKFILWEAAIGLCTSDIEFHDCSCYTCHCERRVAISCCEGIASTGSTPSSQWHNAKRGLLRHSLRSASQWHYPRNDKMWRN